MKTSGISIFDDRKVELTGVSMSNVQEVELTSSKNGN
jgi:hypothetical protein